MIHCWGVFRAFCNGIGGVSASHRHKVHTTRAPHLVLDPQHTQKALKMLSLEGLWSALTPKWHIGGQNNCFRPFPVCFETCSTVQGAW